MSNREAKLLPLCPAYSKFMDSIILMYSEIEDPTLMVNDSVPLASWYRRNMLGEIRKRGSQRLYKHVAKIASGSELIYEDFQNLLIDLHQAWGCEFIDGCDFQRWPQCLEECEMYLAILRPGIWVTVNSSGLLDCMDPFFRRLNYSHAPHTEESPNICLTAGKCGCGAKYSILHHAGKPRHYDRYRSLEEFKKDAKYTTHSDDDMPHDNDRNELDPCSEPHELFTKPTSAPMPHNNPISDKSSTVSLPIKPQSAQQSKRIFDYPSPAPSTGARSHCDEAINRIKQRFGISVRDERIDLMD